MPSRMSSGVKPRDPEQRELAEHHLERAESKLVHRGSDEDDAASRGHHAHGLLVGLGRPSDRPPPAADRSSGSPEPERPPPERATVLATTKSHLGALRRTNSAYAEPENAWKRSVWHLAASRRT